MNGRAFLDVAKELVQGTTEAHWRAAAGRAYYALMLEVWDALSRWGFVVPPREPIHTFVRLRCRYAADPDLKRVGDAVDWLGRLRNHADYQPATPGPFQRSLRVKQAIAEAEAGLVRPDQIDGDATRRTASIASIRVNFP